MPFLPTPTGIRVAASNNEATVKRLVEEVEEESNTKVDVGKAGIKTAESAPVVATNANETNPKGEEEAITKVWGNIVGGLHAGGLAESGKAFC